MNEILFLGFSAFLLGLGLTAFRFGKMYIFILIAVYSILMNIFVLKQFTLFGFVVTGGNALYGSMFLLTDILSEHYGKKEAFKAVIVGFLTSAVFVVATQVLLAFGPNAFDFAHPSLETLFSVTPRILLGSMLAYAIAQSFDVWAFTKIKQWTGDKFLFLRNNGSTLISQAIDTLIFTAVGLTTFSWLPFEGVISTEIFWSVAIATYIIKVVVAFIDTPFLYLSYWVKKFKTQA
jgi:queuosine precursor transporter